MGSRRSRNSEKSREDILKAAEAEFARKGIYGTRVDEIAAAANINKRMIYEYYGSKEELYKSVLCTVYGKLSKKEVDLLSEEVTCKEAIKRIIELQFNFLRDNPTYVNLILWENLNRGVYIKDIDFTGIKDPMLELLRKVIERGKHQGVFKEQIDAEQTILSILTYSFSYFSNRYTLSKILSIDLDSEENMIKRMENVTGMVLGYLCARD